VKHLKNQIISLSVAAILLLSAIGIAVPALTPIPAFAPSDTTDDDFTTDTTDDDFTTDTTDDDFTTDTTDDDFTTGSANDYEILSFLIAVIECFTVNGEEFSDDVQLCLYDVIEEYFDDDGNNVNGNNNSPNSDDNNDTTETDDNNDTTETDDNNDTTETDDNNDTTETDDNNDTTETDDNNDTPSQET
jgi:hypothetical protein